MFPAQQEECPVNESFGPARTMAAERESWRELGMEASYGRSSTEGEDAHLLGASSQTLEEPWREGNWSKEKVAKYVGCHFPATVHSRTRILIRRRVLRRKGALSERHAFSQQAVLALVSCLLLAACLMGAYSLTRFSLPKVEGLFEQFVMSSILSLGTSALFYLTGAEPLRRAVARLAALILVLLASVVLTLSSTAYTFNEFAMLTSRQELFKEWENLGTHHRMELQRAFNCCGFDGEDSSVGIARAKALQIINETVSAGGGVGCAWEKMRPCCHFTPPSVHCRTCDWCFGRWRAKLKRALRLVGIAGLVAVLCQLGALVWMVYFMFSVGILSHTMIDTSGLESMAAIG